ncbi:hypothetical protein BAUCODRAFT_144379 [Baudoinia panamericana UAMH 10762]|uniref:Fe2OG dioxygenase domain-containing protein n=1 Tax=Baudoinia panamericana (strain UAMH 10762) TaxID=717646 RepID=M2M144_BAUPA|nr:uncharacterized protein BAUCODRAFT_144379 [Baudoinia panamericana UAMH 10762]EMD00758.1 hypothetical protein BAUCODRAFT_144379 [Baudoinia panamericana UAMH 10762]
MAKDTSAPFRWRTVVEVAGIAAIIYVLLGAPGLPSAWRTGRSAEKDTPAVRTKIESLVSPAKELNCPTHKYETHVFSSSPLILYVDGFLSDSEAEHLIDISADKWQISTVSTDGIERTDESVRKSEKALVQRDLTVQCIEQRALSFQGWPQDTFIERLWTQRYNESGHFAPHFDWSTATKTARRVSTFMVYVSANCTGGGTQFLRIERPQAESWCQFVECNVQSEGVTFKPRKGAAVFWENFDAEGRGYRETMHAGLPVESGTKIGLNIWSWYQKGYRVDDGEP